MNPFPPTPQTNPAETTRPLLQQIEAMQSASRAQSDAWAAAERALQERLADAGARAAAAEQRERGATERAGAAAAREAAAREAAAEARARGEEAAVAVRREAERTAALEAVVADGKEQVGAGRRVRVGSRVLAASLLSQTLIGTDPPKNSAKPTANNPAQLARLQSTLADLQSDYQQQSAAAKRQLEAERGARVAAQEDLLRLRQELQQGRDGGGRSAGGGNGGGGEEDQRPPAMAGPGFRWVLVRDGETAPQTPQPSQAGNGLGSDRGGGLGGGEGSVPGTPGSGGGLSVAASSLDDLLAAQSGTSHALSASALGLHSYGSGGGGGARGAQQQWRSGGGAAGPHQGAVTAPGLERLRAALKQVG
jgi:hypothetical protein